MARDASLPLFDHSAFVRERDALLALFDSQADDAALSAGLIAFHTLMQEQFAAEETAMAAAAFPPAAAHKADHDRALNQFSALLERWQASGDRRALLAHIETVLADWFVKHVNSRDYITARFLAARG